jgi:hypothetical protein
MAKATADRAVLGGRLLPIRAARLGRMLDEALARVGQNGAEVARAEVRAKERAGVRANVRRRSTGSDPR